MSFETCYQLIKKHPSVVSSSVAFQELSLQVKAENLILFATELKDNPELQFDQLVDVCGVDFLHYKQDEWATTRTTSTGYSRARTPIQRNEEAVKKGRFGVIYHMLSTALNHRIRLVVRLSENQLKIPSVVSLWPSANWYEREVYDLFGIEFTNHGDLRRILTDYGFVGHPFRKDFPVHGKVAMRYDAKKQKCIYEPTDIQPRNVIPKVIRDDNRYLNREDSEAVDQ